MGQIVRLLNIASEVSRIKVDSRTYYHGAVGHRQDDTLVCAYNGAPKEPTPQHHCEARLLRKLGGYGTVYLVRTLADGTWADSTPCIHCQKLMRSHHVQTCFYTVGPNEYLAWVPKSGMILRT